jgi:hypothetical protein
MREEVIIGVRGDGERWGEKPQRRLIVSGESIIGARYLPGLIYMGRNRITYAGTS